MLNYLVSLTDPKGHYIDVTLRFDAPEDSSNSRPLNLWMPTWIPGSYLIREFSRHVVSFAAMIDGRHTHFEKTNKNVWTINPPKGKQTIKKNQLIECSWRIYCWNLSVREAHFDESHCFANGTSLFLVPHGLENQTIHLSFKRPGKHWPADASTWWLASGLNEMRLAANGKLTQGCLKFEVDSELSFNVSNYDALIDHPIEAGELQTAEFNVCKVPHYVAVYGSTPNLDLKKIVADLTLVCETHIKLFEPKQACPPFTSYWFLVHATDNGYGGLEHRNSTALLCNRTDLPLKESSKTPEGYAQFMGLCSHEYFHAWNVKRIKPSSFIPYTLDAESYTQLLWVFEGFTSYYDDLLLRRCGFYSTEQYLNVLAKTMTQVHKSPGHLVQSVTESSFDAWTKYYRQDENAANSIVSYYTKGSLVALCLDLTLRLNTQGKKSLDNVMRYLWKHYGKKNIGIAEQAMPELIQAATGEDLSSQLKDWTESTKPLPIQALLHSFGHVLKVEKKQTRCDLGLSGQMSESGLKVKQVFNHCAGHQAGISAGDELFCINDLKMNQKNLDETLLSTKPGDTISLYGFRAEKLKRFTLIADEPAIQSWQIEQLKSKTNILPPWESHVAKKKKLEPKKGF